MTTSRPTTDPAVGVVIATRDRADRLATSLERLCALPDSPAILVVDNASTDHTRQLVTSRFPGVRVLTLPENRGAVARNHGVAALDTPLVAFSDDDSWWAPGALARAAELFAAYPRLGLLAARTLVGADGEQADPLNAVLARSPLATPSDLPGRQVLGFLGCAAVVRRDAFLDVGGFHPLLFFGSEETLLAYDLSARGWGAAYCPDVVARHAPAPGRRPDRDALVRRNALLTAWLRRPAGTAVHRTTALLTSAVGDPAARRALGGALVRLPAAVRARRRLPPRTEAEVRLVERDEARDREDARSDRHS